MCQCGHELDLLSKYLTFTVHVIERCASAGFVAVGLIEFDLFALYGFPRLCVGVEARGLLLMSEMLALNLCPPALLHNHIHAHTRFLYLPTPHPDSKHSAL